MMCRGYFSVDVLKIRQIKLVKTGASVSTASVAQSVPERAIQSVRLLT